MAQFPFKDFITNWLDGTKALKTKTEISNTPDNPVNVQVTGSFVEYSYNEKPEGQKGNDLLEIDTGKVYVHDGNGWVEI